MLVTFLLILGLVLLLLAGFGAPIPTRLNLVALGLACWLAAELLGRAGPLRL